MLSLLYPYSNSYSEIDSPSNIRANLLSENVLKVDIIENETNIGVIIITVNKYEDYPYEMILELQFYTQIISNLVESAAFSHFILLTIQYRIGKENNTRVSTIELNPTEPYLYISRVVEASDLDHIYIDSMKLDYAFIGNKTIGGSIKLISIMDQFHMRHDFIKRLADFAIEIRKNLIDPGWIRYTLFGMGRIIGRFDIVASQNFSNTSDVRFHMEVIDEIYQKIMNVTLELEGEYLINGHNLVAYSFPLKSGEDIILPNMVGLERQKMKLNMIMASFVIGDYRKFLNVTKDIGVVYISPQKKIITLPLTASLVGVRELGNGWIEFKVGIDDDVDLTNLYVSYVRIAGNEPVIMRSLVGKNLEGHKYLLVIYASFSDMGGHRGLFVVFDGLRRSKIEVNFSVNTTPKDISIYPSEENYTVNDMETYLLLEIDRINRLIRTGLIDKSELLKYQEMLITLKSKLGREENKHTYVLYITLNKTLKFSDTLAISLFYNLTSYNLYQPIEIEVVPVYDDIRWKQRYESNQMFKVMVNGSSFGIYRIPSWTKTANGKLSLSLFNVLYKWNENTPAKLLGFEIRFKNVVNISIQNVTVEYIEVSPPLESTYIHNIESIKEYGKVDIGWYLNFLLPAIMIVSFLTFLVIFIIRRGHS